MQLLYKIQLLYKAQNITFMRDPQKIAYSVDNSDSITHKKKTARFRKLFGLTINIVSSGIV